MLGLINTLIRPLLILLTLPVTLLTLGLFIFVINGLLFWWVGSFVDGFHVSGFWAGFFGAIVYSIISWLLSVAAAAQAGLSAAASRRRAPMTRPRQRLFSLEFFPPRTPEGIERLRATRRQLKQLKPAFCSVTFGAGGSTREGTLATVLEFRAEGMAGGAAHFLHGRRARVARARCWREYKAHDIRHLVALRGDLPSGSARPAISAIASELVAFIREETGDWFHIDVAAYPECHPQARVAAGGPRRVQAQDRRGRRFGDHAVFLQSRCVLALRRRVPRGGHHRADRPGHHADRQLHEARALLGRLRRRDPALDPHASSRATATTPRRSARSASTWSPISRDGLLARGAPGLHFYTLNQAALTTTIWQRLGL